MRDVFIIQTASMAATGAIATTPVTAVGDLDLERYAGTWHEIARLPMYFQRKCTGPVTARYTPRIDGTVAVHNECVTAEGTTIASDGAEVRRHRVLARHEPSP